MKNKTPIKKFYIKEEKYLLLGNGLNLAVKSPGPSWGNLLKQIDDNYNVGVNTEDKTYPLIFEEMAFKIKQESSIEQNIEFLKSEIGEICKLLKPNKYYGQIIKECGYDHFLTTNYDYCIEYSIDQNFDSSKNKNLKNRKYSLRRFNRVKGKKVWHIHGEIDNGLRGKIYKKEESILIGNEHYNDYLRKVHELCKGNSDVGLSKLIQTSKENWVHLFFTRDIDILGFGLNYSESHLWFILNFRARLKRKGVSICNKITFIQPEFNSKKKKSLTSLLRILDVDIEFIKCKDRNYEDFYRKFIKRKNGM